jgi:hypothetical protein
MDLFEAFAVSRRIWPRMTAAIVLAALIFAQRPAASLLEHAAEIHAQRIVTVLEQALDSTLNPRPEHSRQRSASDVQRDLGP